MLVLNYKHTPKMILIIFFAGMLTEKLLWHLKYVHATKLNLNEKQLSDSLNQC